MQVLDACKECPALEQGSHAKCKTHAPLLSLVEPGATQYADDAKARLHGLEADLP